MSSKHPGVTVAFELLDFISRLISLVPNPHVNLTRFHGSFAPKIWGQSPFFVLSNRNACHIRVQHHYNHEYYQADCKSSDLPCPAR